jgi:hypothetical protein
MRPQQMHSTPVLLSNSESTGAPSTTSPPTSDEVNDPDVCDIAEREGVSAERPLAEGAYDEWDKASSDNDSASDSDDEGENSDDDGEESDFERAVNEDVDMDIC